MAGLLHLLSSNDSPAANTVGTSILYVDDQTDLVKDKCVDRLEAKAQQQANSTCEWLRANRMVVAPTKTKLLLASTREMAQRRGLRRIRVVVDRHVVESTQSEKLLGLTLDCHLTWTPHIRGEKWRKKGENEPGLLRHLSTRTTAVKRLMWSLSPKQLREYIDGTVNSTIQYCLPVYSNAWGVGSGGALHKTLCTKDDLCRIQVLQNKALRCLLRRMDGTPWSELECLGVEELTERTKMLSVNQMSVLSTIRLTRNILVTGKPKLVAQRLVLSGTRNNTLQVRRSTSHQLMITSEGFLERATRLWNAVPSDIRRDLELDIFKGRIRKWVEVFCPRKP